jgi:hypothetical protein
MSILRPMSEKPTRNTALEMVYCGEPYLMNFISDSVQQFGKAYSIKWDMLNDGFSGWRYLNEIKQTLQAHIDKLIADGTASDMAFVKTIDTLQAENERLRVMIGDLEVYQRLTDSP